jgi:transcriptional regulator with XRE-family HTH domain
MGTSGISQIETGARNPSAATLSKIADALGVEVRDLFPLEQRPLPDFERERRVAARGDAVSAVLDSTRSQENTAQYEEIVGDLARYSAEELAQLAAILMTAPRQPDPVGTLRRQLDVAEAGRNTSEYRFSERRDSGNAGQAEPLEVLMAGIGAAKLAPLLDEVAATVQEELKKEVQALERAVESGLPQERYPEYHLIAQSLADKYTSEVLSSALVVVMRESAQWGQMPELRRRLEAAYRGTQPTTEQVAKQAQDAE